LVFNLILESHAMIIFNIVEETTVKTMPPGVTLPEGETPGAGSPSPGQPEETTSMPIDCIYDVTPEELSKDEPVEYAGGITADITPDGELVFDFPEPRKVSEITVKTPSGETLEVNKFYTDDL